MISKPSKKDSLSNQKELPKSEKLVVSDQRTRQEIERRTAEKPEPGFNQRIAINHGKEK
jgi:hypothetical protein